MVKTFQKSPKSQTNTIMIRKLPESKLTLSFRLWHYSMSPTEILIPRFLVSAEPWTSTIRIHSISERPAEAIILNLIRRVPVGCSPTSAPFISRRRAAVR